MHKSWTTCLMMAVLGMVAISLSACGPKYPKCDDNEDCQKSDQGKKDDKLFCVNGLCQQCYQDADCGDASLECNAGACEKIEGYCVSASECGEGMKCKANRCAPECTSDGECGDNMRCEANRCVEDYECTADSDCGAGKKCENNACVDAPVAACQLETVFFSYDSASLSSEAQSALKSNAACIKERSGSVQLAGHADERGSEEYNIALGERRAKEAYDYMRRLGVPTGNMSRISYGEEMPRMSCSESDPDSCHRQNRRVEVSFK